MKKVRILLLVLLAAVFVFSATMIVKQLSREKQEQDAFEELQALISDTVEITKETQTPSDPAEEKEDAPEKSRNLDPLFERNPDCIGWVYIDGTKVNYPVMYTPADPQRYIHRNFDGAYSASGVPFLDGACTPEGDNLILYGHNMKNGTMFADITDYRKRDFFTAHPIIEFETAQGLRRFSVFAVVQTKADDPWYSFRTVADEDAFYLAVENIKNRSLYSTDTAVRYGDQLITLSTCYGASDDDRLVVIGAQID